MVVTRNNPMINSIIKIKIPIRNYLSTSLYCYVMTAIKYIKIIRFVKTNSVFS